MLTDITTAKMRLAALEKTATRQNGWLAILACLGPVIWIVASSWPTGLVFLLGAGWASSVSWAAFYLRDVKRECAELSRSIYG